ncbi:DUF4123 domain-containing protein [Halomonas sp. MCCC 1A11036]|uniref:DUF4123 domain-containing protein n=1 Tax=Billgrantia zhangzhouensis TaxID=2733481 RepID=A0ABS9AIQ8_9GAMM|nr:DUF4123 domain-containing protein [Halomonas zhangzhouensis]MCE8021624.1 DUF4123 domain-containing protein [Halomonas zhangzhouensis]
MSQHRQQHTEDQPVVKMAGALTVDLLASFPFALLNPLRVQEQDWRDLPVQALETVPAPVRSHRLPQLVDLGNVAASQHGDLIRRAERYRKRGIAFFSAFLASEKSLEHTAAHLNRQLLQRRPGDRRYWWLRYYDPDVFRHLLWLLSPEQFARLLGPITQWSWPDARGKWRIVERIGARPSIDWLALTRQQWSSLDRFAALNQSLRRLATAVPQWPQDTAHWQWLDATMRYVDETFGLPVEDQQSLAESAAEHHPDLATHPGIRHLLEQAALGAPGFAERLSHLDEMAWSTIISDLRSTT